MDRIVVGVDGSEESRRALRAAVDLGGPLGKPVLALIAWETPRTAAPYPVAVEVIPEAYEENARTALDRALAEVADSGATVDGEVVGGDPRVALLERVGENDLLVLGSHGVGRFRDVLLGSVATYCAHHTPCPILLVP